MQTFKEYCEEKPDKCPMGIKQEVIKEIEKDLISLKEYRHYNPETNLYADEIKEKEELVKQLKK